MSFCDNKFAKLSFSRHHKKVIAAWFEFSCFIAPLWCCFRYSVMIEFRDLTNMNNVVHQHSASPHWPLRLCTAGPSTLLYSDRRYPDPDAVEKCIIRWLDCSSSTPKPDGELVTEQDYLFDMCCTEDEGKSLVITTDYCQKAIRCYNRDSGKLLWKVEGKLPGMGKKIGPRDITVDGLGHLFVTDENNKCIQKLSGTGEYLGVHLKEGDQGLGELKDVQWHDASSSLVVGHAKWEQATHDQWRKQYMYISVVSLQ